MMMDGLEMIALNYYVKITVIITEFAKMAFVCVKAINGLDHIVILDYVLITVTSMANVPILVNVFAKLDSQERIAQHHFALIIVMQKEYAKMENVNASKGSMASTAVKKFALVIARTMGNA